MKLRGMFLPVRWGKDSGGWDFIPCKLQARASTCSANATIQMSGWFTQLVSRNNNNNSTDGEKAIGRQLHGLGVLIPSHFCCYLYLLWATGKILI